MWNDDENILRFSREGNLREVSAGPVAVASNGTVVKRRPEDLTPREQEILQLVWAGLTNRTIAEQLHISIKTAEAHRANMMKKLRVSNIAQLLKTALEEGLLAHPYRRPWRTAPLRPGMHRRFARCTAAHQRAARRRRDRRSRPTRRPWRSRRAANHRVNGPISRKVCFAAR